MINLRPRICAFVWRVAASSLFSLVCSVGMRGCEYVDHGCFFVFEGVPHRDLDLWPCSASDHSKLLDLLKRIPNCSLHSETLFNRQFIVTIASSCLSSSSSSASSFPSSSSSVMMVELVTKTVPPCLRDKVLQFDLSLSAVGVEFCDEAVESVFVHPDFLRSLLLQEPLLILPMPNFAIFACNSRASLAICS